MPTLYDGRMRVRYCKWYYYYNTRNNATSAGMAGNSKIIQLAYFHCATPYIHPAEGLLFIVKYKKKPVNRLWILNNKWIHVSAALARGARNSQAFRIPQAFVILNIKKKRETDLLAYYRASGRLIYWRSHSTAKSTVSAHCVWPA